jgi:hypothetical protein
MRLLFIIANGDPAKIGLFLFAPEYLAIEPKKGNAVPYV